MSNHAKTIFVHILRGLAYAVLPIGAFLIGHIDDSLSSGYILSAIVGGVCFFLSAGIVIFLHPHKRNAVGPRRTFTAYPEFYLPHLFLVIALATVGYIELPRLFLSFVLPMLFIIGPM